jgi:protoheme IX farnesyltransferase
VSDADYKRAGIRLLPTTKKDKISSVMIFLSCLLMLAVGFLPLYYGFGGWVFTIVSLLGGLMFVWYAYKHVQEMSDASAKKIMYTSFAYLPITQLVLLFDFIRF